MTGGGKGIGEGIAYALADAGADVAILARTAAADSAERAAAFGMRVHGVRRAPDGALPPGFAAMTSTVAIDSVLRDADHVVGGPDYWVDMIEELAG